MKKYLLLSLSLLFLAAACGRAPQPETAPQEEAAMLYAGAYDGTLPCADCSGIETELILNPDYTYSLIELYLDGERELVLLEGNWQFNPKGYIELGYDDEFPPRLFFTMQDKDLVKLDINARPINSALNYTLKRK